ncbi:MAG: exo-alpha-sialidase [Ignavibacteriaceae bacterium]
MKTTFKNKLIPLTLILISALISLFIFIERREDQDEKKQKISGALKALELWGYQRAYPYDYIPDVSHYASYQNAKLTIRKEKEENISEDSWESIGPHNTAGRTLAIAFNPQNPNTIYCGSASGGLWRSYSGGTGIDAWHNVSTGFPVLGVSTIAISPEDSNTIYIGTGEVYNHQGVGTGAAYRSNRGTYGIGILKSTDAGTTWEKSLDWSYNQQRGVWMIKINPLNSNTLYAATTEGVYKSFDAGENWFIVNDVVMGTDVVINSIDTNIVISAHGNFQSPGFGIYRSTDGGGNWTQITNGVPTNQNGKIQLAIYEPDPDIVYASIGNGFSSSEGASWLCKSYDAGATWSIINTTDYSKWQGWFSHDVAVSPVNPDYIMVIGIEIWRSTNGGQNLTKESYGGVTLGRPPVGGPDGDENYVHSDAHDVVYHPTDPNIIYFGTDGGVFRSTDGGVTFRDCNGRLQTTQFYNGFSSSTIDSLFCLGGLQDNSTVIYDGSLAWTRNIGGDGSWTAINNQDDNIVFGSWQYLNILKSTDKGEDFDFSVSPPSSANTCFIAPFILSPAAPSVMYAGNDKIYRSANSGQNWSATNGGAVIDGNPVFCMASSFTDPDFVYAGTAPYTTRGQVFVTTNGGDNWINITGNLPDRYPTDLAVDPANHENVYVTFSGFGTSHLFKSTDAGNNWIDISAGLPDVPTSAVVVDPENPEIIYAGNDIGVYVSTDGGTHWIDFNDGLPDAVIVMDLSISPRNRKLRVATHGNGVYERKLVEANPSDADLTRLLPYEFYLEQNYPNPFNPVTKIKYTVPVNQSGEEALVLLKVYDLRGREVKTIVHRELPAGHYEVTFDASGLSSGVYIYSLYSDQFTISKKMILLR